MTNTISFTKEEQTLFKKRYNKAVKNLELEFIFKDSKFLTLYAKYLIQYMDNNNK